MAEIQMTPTWPLRAEPSAETTLVAGDAGFALMPDPLPAWAGAMPGGLGADATATDPLTRWLEGMLGLSAEFAAPPAAEPDGFTAAALAVRPDADMVPPDEVLPTIEMPVPVDPGTTPAAPERPARLEAALADAPLTDAPPAAPTSEEGGIHLASQGGTDKLSVADSAPEPLPASPLPRIGRDPARSPASVPIATAAPPLATVETKEAGRVDVADADPPIPDALRPDQPPGGPFRSPVAPEQDLLAGRTPVATLARSGPTDPAGKVATGIGMAESDPVDLGAPRPTDGTDTARALREIGPAARAGSPQPPGPVEGLVAHDMRPTPEFRMAEMSRPSLPTASGGPEVPPDPRPILRQVTDALIVTRGDRTEIALAPEELGRIRLVLSGPERGQITLWAERPDTLDLVRRNADLLTQQLSEAGVTADSLDFRQDDRRSGAAAPPPEPIDGDAAQTAPPALRVSLAPVPLSDRRIDIRL